MNPKPMIARSSSSPASFIFEIQLGRENGRDGRAEEQHIVHRLRVNRTRARRSYAWQGGSEARGVYNGRSVQTLVSMRTSNAGVIPIVIRVIWEFNVRVWGCSMGDEGGYLRKSLGVCVAKKYEGGRVKLVQTEVDFEFQDEEILAGGVFRPSPSFNLTTPSSTPWGEGILFSEQQSHNVVCNSVIRRLIAVPGTPSIYH
ncbi:hypothetical protein SCHPADRAFT_943569 [Schizopora paradoxa]|uniref:Uncharacterized protein n=1 Tax=Schizopora paradoxa TaxID=27342 RepID=A0A0H2RDC9_9AGAM|nr:hypothetical protein SCHPADRAFT_943569 [Schizopora paradoxa]